MKPLLLAFSLYLPLHLSPRPLVTPKPHLALTWYMGEDGHAVRCSGKPYLVYLPLRVAVDGCEGPHPQVILKD